MRQRPYQVLNGYVSQVTSDSQRNTYEVSGFETMLQSKPNLTVQYNCVRRFGSGGCGVLPVYHRTIIDDIVSGSSIGFVHPLPLPLERYQFGKVRVLQGAFAGYEMEILEATSSTSIKVRGTSVPADFTSLPIVIATGCTKTYAACLANNNDRYLGFPSVPGSAIAFTAAETITRN